MLVKCDVCGREYGVGHWPYCPHEVTNFHVDAFEPRYDEMLSTDGLTYSSNREKIRYMDRHGIVEKKNPHDSRIARGSTGAALFFDMVRK